MRGRHAGGEGDEAWIVWWRKNRDIALVAWKDIGYESKRRRAHLSYRGIATAADFETNGSEKNC
jgi:hypothetical protein